MSRLLSFSILLFLFAVSAATKFDTIGDWTASGLPAVSEDGLHWSYSETLTRRDGETDTTLAYDVVRSPRLIVLDEHSEILGFNFDEDSYCVEITLADFSFIEAKNLGVGSIINGVHDDGAFLLRVTQPLTAAGSVVRACGVKAGLAEALDHSNINFGRKPTADPVTTTITELLEQEAEAGAGTSAVAQALQGLKSLYPERFAAIEREVRARRSRDLGMNAGFNVYGIREHEVYKVGGGLGRGNWVDAHMYSG